MQAAFESRGIKLQVRRGRAFSGVSGRAYGRPSRQDCCEGPLVLLSGTPYIGDVDISAD